MLRIESYKASKRGVKATHRRRNFQSHPARPSQNAFPYFSIHVEANCTTGIDHDLPSFVTRDTKKSIRRFSVTFGRVIKPPLKHSSKGSNFINDLLNDLFQLPLISLWPTYSSCSLTPSMSSTTRTSFDDTLGVLLLAGLFGMTFVFFCIILRE